MSGPLAFTTALVAGVIGLLLCAVGGGSLTTAESPSSRLTALALLALGLFALGSVVLGVIAFFRANRERG